MSSAVYKPCNIKKKDVSSKITDEEWIIERLAPEVDWHTDGD